METPLETAELLRRALVHGLLPLWLAAGFADWACHRVERIEASAGWRETRLHLAMLAELAVGLFAAVFLEPSAGAFGLMAAAVVAHELTTWRDLAYANAQRRIPAPEQCVHGLQQTLPWIGLVGLALLAPGQALAALGLGEAPADWALRWRDPPPPWPPVLGYGGAALLAVGLPFADEARRAWRRRPRA